MSANFEIIVGTYEQFFLGYQIQTAEKKYNLERSFATHSHVASIRDVATKGRYLATGGADDTVFLYDMRHRMESGRLMHHTDTVNCLEFTPQASHLMTASSDGSIGIVRCGNWQLEKHWKAAHKGSPVNALAIHPTGKLAMTAGGDGVLRTWNLVKGRQAYATNLVPRLKYDAKNLTILVWSPDGDKYLLACNTKLDVYCVETAGLSAEIVFDTKVVCIDFIDNDHVVVGHEDGKIRICDLSNDKIILEVEAHDARVKCLAYKNNYVVSASSSGEIKFWRYSKGNLSILSRATCDARITCMTLADIMQGVGAKKEAPEIAEKVVKSSKNIFRMRQEVIIEDEGQEMPAKKSKKRKKGMNKTNGSSIATEIEETDEKTTKKKKTGIFKADNVESPNKTKKKKGNWSVEQIIEVPMKKGKTAIVEDEIAVTETKTLKKKKKKKVGTEVPEKPGKPSIPVKRKHEKTSTSTTFPTKMKKKKVTR